MKQRTKSGRPATSPLVPLPLVDEIADDLKRVGVRAGGVLLVHSSLSSMGHVPGGAETVIQGLLEALGPEGTLLMPALSYEHVSAKQPYFDVRRTPSNIGAIPETFRRRAGTRRSMHPTHSVCAVGRRTAELLRGHELDTTPCGTQSPFHKLPNVRGQILMLGCGLLPNTSMHAIEEIVVPPYLFSDPRTYVLVDEEGRSREVVHTPHGFDGWRQRYDRVAQVLAEPGLREGTVLKAGVHLIEARALWAGALEALRGDELFFVERGSHD